MNDKERQVLEDLAALIRAGIEEDCAPQSIHFAGGAAKLTHEALRAAIQHPGDCALAAAARAGLPFIAYAFAHGVDGAEGAGRAIETALAGQRPGYVTVPVEVLELYRQMNLFFTPATRQQEELRTQLCMARIAMGRAG